MKNRSKILAIKKRFIKVPWDILHLGLDTTSISIYLVLCSFSEGYNPTLGKIARTLGIHRNTVCSALKRLELAGVIEKTVQGSVMRVADTQVPSQGSRQSEYRFTDPATWNVTRNVASD